MSFDDIPDTDFITYIRRELDYVKNDWGYVVRVDKDIFPHINVIVNRFLKRIILGAKEMVESRHQKTLTQEDFRIIVYTLFLPDLDDVIDSRYEKVLKHYHATIKQMKVAKTKKDIQVKNKKHISSKSSAQTTPPPKTKTKRISEAEKAGLRMSPSRVLIAIKSIAPGLRVGNKVALYITSILQYVLNEWWRVMLRENKKEIKTIQVNGKIEQKRIVGRLILKDVESTFMREIVDPHPLMESICSSVRFHHE